MLILYAYIPTFMRKIANRYCGVGKVIENILEYLLLVYNISANGMINKW